MDIEMSTVPQNSNRSYLWIKNIKLNSRRYFVPKIGNIILENMKNLTSFDTIKRKLSNRN